MRKIVMVAALASCGAAMAITDAEIVKEIEEIDITMLTPLDGLNLLYQIQNKIKNRI